MGFIPALTDAFGHFHRADLPKGTSPEIVAKLNAATNAYPHSAKAESFLNNLGVAIAGGTPEQLKSFNASELGKWGPIIKAANISF